MKIIVIIEIIYFKQRNKYENNLLTNINKNIINNII